MRIAFIRNNIEIINPYSKQNLLEFMSKFKNSVLLGGKNEFEKEFTALIINKNYEQDRTHSLCVGICSMSNGITPQLMVQDNSQVIWIGFDFEVNVISLKNIERISHIDLDCTFYQFIPIVETGLILIQHEIGVLVADTIGNTIWKISKDIINDLKVIDNQVQINWMDGDKSKLDLKNGELL